MRVGKEIMSRLNTLGHRDDIQTVRFPSLIEMVSIV